MQERRGKQESRQPYRKGGDWQTSEEMHAGEDSRQTGDDSRESRKEV